MKDRAPLTGAGSPFFSGREVEINQFRESAGQLAKGFRANNTLVFEGPPGCGKTALLDQITADVNAYPADSAPNGATRRMIRHGGLSVSHHEKSLSTDF